MKMSTWWFNKDTISQIVIQKIIENQQLDLELYVR